MKARLVLLLIGTLVWAASPAPMAFGKGKTDKAAAAKAAEPKPAQVIEISVTKEGFVPKEVKVKAGQPVKLQVTRKIEKTCAKDIVIKDYNISEPLPLDKTVTVTFTPGKAGTTRFACAMDMIAGVIVAE